MMLVVSRVYLNKYLKILIMWVVQMIQVIVKVDFNKYLKLIVIWVIRKNQVVFGAYYNLILNLLMMWVVQIIKVVIKFDYYKYWDFSITSSWQIIDFLYIWYYCVTYLILSNFLTYLYFQLYLFCCNLNLNYLIVSTIAYFKKINFILSCYLRYRNNYLK
jgi:hypothetical protein